jgi:hypothetical protein
MAANKTPIATDSAASLHDLIGDDATATFENDPKFIDSNPTDTASSEHVTLRDTDDVEDSDEEEDEEEEEDEDEDEDFDDEDEEEEETSGDVLRTAEANDLRGRGRNAHQAVEKELEEMQDEDDAGQEAVPEEQNGGDNPQVDRAIDSALRMSTMAFAATRLRANATLWSR